MIYGFTGYHGTNKGCCESIQKTNFFRSEESDEWLGYGVYFFTHGLGNPVEHAEEWAINQAFDGKMRPKKYDHYGVLEAKVNAENFLNTTTNEGLVAFNSVRDKLIEKHRADFKRDRGRFDDNRIIWELVADLMELDVVIHNLYIKNSIQRKLRIASNVPNTTVMCVKSTSSIDRDSISVVKEGSTCDV